MSLENQRDPGLVKLEELYHGTITPDIAALSKSEIKHMLKLIADRAALYFEEEYQKPRTWLYTATDEHGRSEPIAKVKNKKYMLQRQKLDAQFSRLSTLDLSPIQKHAIYEVYNAVEQNLLGIAISDVDSNSSFQPAEEWQERSLLRVELEGNNYRGRDFIDLFMHEAGHAATYYDNNTTHKDYPTRDRDNPVTLLQDELRQILREPSVHTPNDAWKRLEDTYGHNSSFA